MKIANGKKVRLEYELKVVDGEVIESSKANGPLEYIHGQGKMLPGLERRLEGLSVGDERDGTIPAAEAYGTAESLPTRQMTRGEFPGDGKIEIGKRFEAKGPGGATVEFVVIAVEGDDVTIRFNHPLVDKTIHFRVKVLQVAEPGQPPPTPAE